MALRNMLRLFNPVVSTAEVENKRYYSFPASADIKYDPKQFPRFKQPIIDRDRNVMVAIVFGETLLECAANANLFCMELNR